MITASAERVLEKWREKHTDTLPGLRVIISAPEGEELAARTFNPKLGITGGISILGTTGIVEPMSDRAVVETIRAQMSVLKEEGDRFVVMAPGNYGLSFLTKKYGLREDRVVLISFGRSYRQTCQNSGRRAQHALHVRRPQDGDPGRDRRRVL